MCAWEEKAGGVWKRPQRSWLQSECGKMSGVDFQKDRQPCSCLEDPLRERGPLACLGMQGGVQSTALWWSLPPGTLGTPRCSPINTGMKATRTGKEKGRVKGGGACGALWGVICRVQTQYLWIPLYKEQDVQPDTISSYLVEISGEGIRKLCGGFGYKRLRNTASYPEKS